MAVVVLRIQLKGWQTASPSLVAVVLAPPLAIASSIRIAISYMIYFFLFLLRCSFCFVLYCHQIYVLLIKNWRSTRFIIIFCIWEGGTTCTRLLLGTTNLDSFLYFFISMTFKTMPCLPFRYFFKILLWNNRANFLISLIEMCVFLCNFY